jgi:hydroxyacylglutathione hydrolase
VLIVGFPAGSFAANCYLVASGPRSECVIIDPGQDAEQGISEVIDEYHLQPVAVLATHGHIDHIWSVAPVCGARGIPAYIHPADRALLSDPGRGLSLAAGQQFFGGLTFTEPDDVRELTDGMTLELAGLELVVDHAPGHTPGSVTFGLPPVTEAGTLFSGDLLFAGSIGRTCRAETTRQSWPAWRGYAWRCLARRRSCRGTGRRRRSRPSEPTTRSWLALLPRRAR